MCVKRSEGEEEDEKEQYKVVVRLASSATEEKKEASVRISRLQKRSQKLNNCLPIIL